MRSLAVGVLAALLPPLLLAAAPAHEHPAPTVLAPGYATLEFEPPAPGSYSLPPLGQAANGEVRNTSGEKRYLHDYLGDKLVVLSFIYTTCNDVNGCPLATHVLRGLQNRIKESQALRDRVRLISFSFDPDNDTPDVLGKYGKQFKQPDFDWQFLTCNSDAELAPVLEDYDQWVVKDYDDHGRYLGTMSHVLRVYLIDTQKRIRNIYSIAFLHADTVANDIHTLLMEGKNRAGENPP